MSVRRVSHTDEEVQARELFIETMKIELKVVNLFSASSWEPHL